LKVSSRRAKQGIGVNEHGVEEVVGERAGPVVSFSVAADQDVAQAAGREGAQGARLLEQRHQLARELGPTEREELDQHDARLHAAERHQDAPVPDLPRALEVAVARAEPVLLHTQRRQRDELDVLGRLDAVGEIAAGEQDDLEVLGQAGAERVGAHQVAEADRMLAVEEQRGLHAATGVTRFAPASSSSLSWASCTGR
jgi:hypothetical protein